MKISFLVTYYNQEQFVEQSMNSILAIHKPCEWEILVGDDGSTDKTRDIVRKYMQMYPENIFLHTMPRDPNVKYAPVQRASANRINLLEQSTGDIYCILDGDDCYCDTHFLERAMRIFESSDDVATIMFGFKYVMDGIDGAEVVLPSQYHEHILDKEQYLNRMYVHAGACLFRNVKNRQKAYRLKAVGFFDDNDIVVYNMNFGEIYCLNQVIYAYRQTGSSVYTSMNRIEQALLNVQGYDVDVNLAPSQYASNILVRNKNSLITVFIWRKYIEQIIGTDKYQRYVQSTKHIEPSVLLDILMMDSKSAKKKSEINKFACSLMLQNIKFTAKNYLELFAYLTRNRRKNEKK